MQYLGCPGSGVSQELLLLLSKWHQASLLVAKPTSLHTEIRQEVFK